MKNYVIGVMYQLIDEASVLKQDANTDFSTGVLQGYYETISRLLNQAEAYGITEQLPKNLQEYCPEDLFDKDKDGNVQKTDGT